MLVNLYVRHTEVSRYVNNFHIEFSRENYIRKKLC